MRALAGVMTKSGCLDTGRSVGDLNEYPDAVKFHYSRNIAPNCSHYAAIEVTPRLIDPFDSKISSLEEF